MNKKSENEAISRFSYKHLAGFVAFLTPLAYLVGASYYQGRLEAFDVDSIMFHPSIPDIYIYSFSAVGSLLSEIFYLVAKLAGLLNKHTWIFTIIFIAFSLFATSYFKLKDKKNTSEKTDYKKLKKARKALKRSNLFKGVMIAFFVIYLMYAALIIAAALAPIWWLAPVSALNLGYTNNLKLREEFDQKGCCVESRTKYSKCKAIINKDGSEYIRGILVASSGNYLAFYTQQGSSTFSMPTDSSLRSVRLSKSCSVKP